MLLLLLLMMMMTKLLTLDADDADDADDDDETPSTRFRQAYLFLSPSPKKDARSFSFFFFDKQTTLAALGPDVYISTASAPLSRLVDVHRFHVEGYVVP